MLSTDLAQAPTRHRRTTQESDILKGWPKNIIPINNIKIYIIRLMQEKTQEILALIDSMNN
jgi:hypothetical protein